MSRLSLLLLLSLAALVCEARLRSSSVRLSANPGAVFRIRRTATDSFFKSSASLAVKYAHKCPFPDMTATVSGVDLETKDVRITSLIEPRVTYDFIPPNGVKGELCFPSITVQGPFNATRRTLFKTQKDNGQVSFTAKDVCVKFLATLGAFDNGIPNVAGFECESNLGAANLNVKGCKEKFATEVMTVAAKGFRPGFNAAVCPMAKKLVSGQLNRLLSKMPNVLELNPKVAVKFQVQPVIGADYIEVRLFGKVITDEVSPYAPAKFVELPNGDAMVVALVSDAVFNDAAYQAYNGKLLQVTINNKSPALLYSLLKLQCDKTDEACLGQACPHLAGKFGGDAAVEITFKAAKAPVITFEQGKATFAAALTTDLFVTPSNGSEKIHETTAAVDISGTLQVRIVNGVLFGKVTITKVDAKLDEENAKKWEDKIKSTIGKIVENYINGDLLLKGCPLKLPFGFGLEEPLISFQPGTMQVHTGFDYKAKTSAEDNSRPRGN